MREKAKQECYKNMFGITVEIRTYILIINEKKEKLGINFLHASFFMKKIKLFSSYFKNST